MRVASSVLFFSIAFVSTGQSLVGNGRPHACVAERSSNTSQSQESAQDDEKTLGSIFAKIMEAGSDPEPKVPLDESALSEAWEGLSNEQAGRVIVRNLSALVQATHQYHEAQGSLPPAVVPNPGLAPEKRLSGLVLLLPHLKHVTQWKKGGERVPMFEPAFVDFANKLYEKIDLTKAWDDPVNAAAAKTVVPIFLAPAGGTFRNKKGQAVSHFAFVRGPAGRDAGAFTEDTGVTVTPSEKMIADGTVVTLALGQIHEKLGPWIAAGHSTARYLYHPDDEAKTPTFGTRFENAGYFATCDGYAFFLDLKNTPESDLYALATYAGGEFIYQERLVRYGTAAQWLEKKNK